MMDWTVIEKQIIDVHLFYEEIMYRFIFVAIV